MWTFDQLKPLLAVFGSGALAVLVRGTLATFWSPDGWEYVPYAILLAVAASLPPLAWLYVDRYRRSAAIRNPKPQI